MGKYTKMFHKDDAQDKGNILNVNIINIHKNRDILTGKPLVDNPEDTVKGGKYRRLLRGRSGGEKSDTTLRHTTSTTYSAKSEGVTTHLPAEPGDPALAEALADYLQRNPEDVERDPYWLGATLWCYDLYPGKPTRDEIRQALRVISPEHYARNERAVMRRREEAADNVAGSVGARHDAL